jgi:hypothetical protein
VRNASSLRAFPASPAGSNRHAGKIEKTADGGSPLRLHKFAGIAETKTPALAGVLFDQLSKKLLSFMLLDGCFTPGSALRAVRGEMLISYRGMTEVSATLTDA